MGEGGERGAFVQKAVENRCQWRAFYGKTVIRLGVRKAGDETSLAAGKLDKRVPTRGRLRGAHSSLVGGEGVVISITFHPQVQPGGSWCQELPWSPGPHTSFHPDKPSYFY